DDVVSSDLNKASDIFVRDMDARVTTLVSERNLSMPAAATGTALTRLHPGAFSANGQKLIFVSRDSVLVPNDTNLWQDLFMRDLLAGTNIGISGPLVTNLSFPNGPAYVAQTNSAIAASISA